jgi:glycosyltransferase involved in cell wall biosynthesis
LKQGLIFFTKYTDRGPSSRYRTFQYKKYFDKDFNVDLYPLFNSDYIDNLYKNKNISFFDIIKAYLLRILKVVSLLGTKKLVFIEYELFPYFPPIFEYLLYKTNVRVILDYDDAIFHNYDNHRSSLIRIFFSRKISSVAKFSNLIITGSPYLSNYFLQHQNNVVEIPTSIELEKYNYKIKKSNNLIKIGWIGSKSTSINLIFLKEVIREFETQNRNVLFIFMGFDKLLENCLAYSNVKFYEWSEEEELAFLSKIDLGIMPLSNTPFNQGKCGFKLIQYMAMGKPTISTPLMANVKINRNNKNMFATSIKEWIDCINNYINNKEFFDEVGFNNIKIVKEYYSVEANVSIYIKLLNDMKDVRN